MENQTNNFAGGLHSDFNEQNQPENTYRESYNWIRSFDGSLSNEKGTLATITGLPNKKVLGACSVEDELVLCLEPNEIGYVKANTYHSIVVREDLAFSSKVNLQAKVNYKNDRVVYFVDGINEDRVITYNSDQPIDNTNTDLSLQIDSKQPRVKLESVNDSGSLPTGIYQFSARLITSTGNKTSSSLMCNPISITNEQGSTSFSVDGAPPQSSGFKSITITIDNLDSKFNFVEIIATTYMGITNVPRSWVVGMKPIPSSGVISFTYESFDQNREELTIDELTIEPIVYKNSKLIQLKDNYLFRANVTTSKQDINFQSVANNAVVKYSIKTLPYTESINIDKTNKDNVGSSTYIPYKDPVISATVRGYQRGEVYSLAIVPKFKDGSYGWAYHIPCTTAFNSTEKTLDTYISNLTYPEGYGFPIGNIKHHKMPNLSQEPIYDGNNIRVLGLTITIDLDSYLSSEERELIDGVLIVRQRRTEQHKSILSQGIAQNLVQTGGTQNLLMVSPYHGKPNYLYGVSGSTNYKRNYVAFYSPETTIDQESMMSATSIEPIGYSTGVGYLIADEREGDRHEKYSHIFLDFKNYTYVNKTPAAIARDTIQYIGTEQGDFRVYGNNVTERFSTKESNGYLFFKTNTDLSIFKNEVTSDVVAGTVEISYDEVENEIDRIIVQKNGQQLDQDTSGREADVSRLIYNLVSEKNSQYGDVLSAEYMVDTERLFDANYISIINGDTLASNTIECFGGDIFINKVAIMSTTAEIQDGDNRDRYGLKFRTLSYVMLESTINTSLRHSISSGDNMTIPYFPKYSNLWKDVEQNGLLNIDPKLGHSNGYNKQYSFDNGLKKFFTKSLLQPIEQTTLTNRVIYSELSVEGEQYDANRVFLPNNYHDIPRSRGSIVDMFVFNNILYLHTPQTLYRTYTNEQTAIVTTSGQVATGNGGLFPRPSIEMTTVSGGYGGSFTPNGCNTPYGRLWIDQLQKKIFMLGESMQEVSVNCISKYLQDNVTLVNYVSGYDYRNRRWLVTSDDFTISYFPELKSFTSYHDYKPHIIVTHADRMFLGSTTNFQELNIGSEGSYFDSIYPSTINLISNDNPLITKSFDNITIQATDCLSSLKVIGDNKSSIIHNLMLINDFDYEIMDGELLVKYKNNQYQLALPRAIDETRFKNKWVELELTYDNNQPLNLKYITMLYRPVFR